MKKIITFFTFCLFMGFILTNSVAASDSKSYMNNFGSNEIINYQLVNPQSDPITSPSKCKLSYNNCKILQPKIKLSSETLYAAKYYINNCESYNNLMKIINSKDVQVITENQLITETQTTASPQITTPTQINTPTQITTPTQIYSQSQAATQPQITTKPHVNSQIDATTPTQSSNAPVSQGNLDNVNANEFREFQKKVIEIVNKERASMGLHLLSENADLDKVATLKSEDMVKLNYFSHTSPTYGSPFQMLEQFKISYTSAGENIAYGQTTPEEVMKGWMNSPGHRANILNSNFTQIGVGIALKSNGQLDWTQTFIRP